MDINQNNMHCFIFIILVLWQFNTVHGQLRSETKIDFKIGRAEMIADIISLNLKKNGWSTILCAGVLPDEFFQAIRRLTNYTLVVINIDQEDKDLEDVVKYHANSIVISIGDMEYYEDTLFKVMDSPYWHPHSNILIYYHQRSSEHLAKIFFSLWYFRAINAIVVQYDGAQETFLISHYSPYISDDYRLDHLYGCWTTKKINIPVRGFNDGFTCEEKCHNVSIQSKLRVLHLGTCIGYSIISAPYTNLTSLNYLFEDKSINLHGFEFRTHVAELKPFLRVDDIGNGSYKLSSREGLVWNVISQRMNFKMHCISNISDIKKPFNYHATTKKLFEFSARKIDLSILPIYLFDYMILEIDYSIPYSDSGVCILAHRAGYERKFLNSESFNTASEFLVKFFICFIGIWFTFALYQWAEKKTLSFDQIGKDLLNTFRNVLMVTPHNPPQHRFFRPFLTISMWGFFAFNFVSQALITSVLAAVKRGKDVETFQDIIEKGYHIYGIASPDILDPDAEENYRIITSRIIHLENPFECVTDISYDSKRFCLIDCNMGRYLERNRLNDKGEQYLHLARERIHSHYLVSMLPKNSPLTARYSHYLRRFCEAGLIKKWEQYRFNVIKEEVPVRPLGMDDYENLLKAYCYALGFAIILFLSEWLVFRIKVILEIYISKRKNKRTC